MNVYKWHLQPNIFIKMQMNKITLRDARINIERLNHIEAVVEIANFYLT